MSGDTFSLGLFSSTNKRLEIPLQTFMQAVVHPGITVKRSDMNQAILDLSAVPEEDYVFGRLFDDDELKQCQKNGRDIYETGYSGQREFPDNAILGDVKIEMGAEDPGGNLWPHEDGILVSTQNLGITLDSEKLELHISLSLDQNDPTLIQDFTFWPILYDDADLSPEMRSLLERVTRVSEDSPVPSVNGGPEQQEQIQIMLHELLGLTETDALHPALPPKPLPMTVDLGDVLYLATGYRDIRINPFDQDGTEKLLINASCIGRNATETSYDEDDKSLFILDPQRQIKDCEGSSVTIYGLDGDQDRYDFELSAGQLLTIEYGDDNCTLTLELQTNPNYPRDVDDITVTVNILESATTPEAFSRFAAKPFSMNGPVEERQLFAGMVEKIFNVPASQLHPELEAYVTVKPGDIAQPAPPPQQRQCNFG